MSASTSVHSNALNFMSCLNSGVDPRTGLYNVSITLPELQSNQLRGPGLALGLAFSPLNTLDTGYGRGWGLQLSQYDPGSQVLALSTGETFKVTGSNGNRLLMEEQKLLSFLFYRDDATHFRVKHSSGQVEILEIKGNGERSVALPVQIFSATGHSIRLLYKPFSNTHYLLERIIDDLDQPLLEIIRESTTVELQLYPQSAPDGGPASRFVMTLLGAEKYVSRITLPTENQASWRFEYSALAIGHIAEVWTPTGGHEEVFYQDGGHKYPVTAAREPLPRVTRHRIHPGFEQPAIDTRYTYKRSDRDENNFLGYGLALNWLDEGLDNLYQHLGEYDYVCTESLWVEDVPEEPVRTIDRTFNRFHLQTVETTAQNGHVQTVTTTYNLTPGVHYRQQPNDCQLPREITKSWGLSADPTHFQNEHVSNTYDNQGNLKTHTRADGIVETSNWYPADSDGFVRYLQDRTVHPAPSAQPGAPTLCTRYTYQTLPALPASQLDDWVVSESETLVLQDGANELELQSTRNDYFDSPDDTFLYGRIKQQTQRINGYSSISTYTYETLESPQLGVPVQESTMTLSSDFDATSRTILRQHSLVTAQELLNQTDGVESRYQFDALNRLLRETVAPDTEFEASREYEYVLCAQAGEQAAQQVYNARGASTRVLLDGLGRPIHEERDHVDAATPNRFQQTYAAQYNAWGVLEQDSGFDWLEGTELRANRRFAYDNWGQQCCITGDDGVETHQYYDPIGTHESNCPIQHNWVQSAGPNPTISGRSETWLNLFGKAERVMSLDAAQQLLGSKTFLYDGLGRCTQQTDELRHETSFRYDAWSRMISSTLPDSSVIEREYAPHSSAELAISLSVIAADGVTRTLAGEQAFDGLQRLTQIKVGLRSEQFAYDGDRMQVKTRTTAAGDSIRFDYNLLLTDQPISSTAPDEQAEFAYDRTSARLSRAQNDLGVRNYDYDVLNQLQGESWIDDQGKTWQTAYLSSLQGRPLKRTELKQGTTPGLDTAYHYGTTGRLERIDQGDLQATFEYDALGQVSLITSRDQVAGTTLLTALQYDDQGRETHRTLTLAPHPPRTLEQTWQIDGLLQSRHLQQGGVTQLLEIFNYDKRGRLTTHTCSGPTLPRDAEGREITQQIFTFDALDNLKLSMTTFADSTFERAVFSYAGAEPCQLTGITYLPAGIKPDLMFSYDLNGNQLNDERGQHLIYDSQSRLLNVHSASGQPVSQYRYDGHDHLVTSQHGSDSETLRFYQGQQLSSSVQNNQQKQFLHMEALPLGQQQPGDPSQTLLLMTDANQSVIGESQQNDLRTAVYSAYGEQHSDDDMISLLGFNGEISEAASGWYLLGKGYRAYNPGLMRFHSPDSLSPFGAGGVNPYAYCLGNPIALRDPSGHDASGSSGRLRKPDEDVMASVGGGSDAGGILSWVMVGVGVAFTAWGVYATALSFGTAAPISVPVTVMGITTTTTAVAAVATGALATATTLAAVSTGASAYAAATGDETANYVAMGTGLASIPFSFGTGFLSSAVKAAVKNAELLVRARSLASALGGGVNRGTSQVSQSAARLSSETQTLGTSVASVSTQTDDIVLAAPKSITGTTKSAVSTSSRPPISMADLSTVKLKPTPSSGPKPAGAMDELKLAIAAQAEARSQGNTNSVMAGRIAGVAAQGRSAIVEGSKAGGFKSNRLVRV